MNRRIRSIISLLGIIACLAMVPAQSLAGTGNMNYQGYLTDAAGLPVSGPVNLTVSIYDAPAAGNLLWSDTVAATVTAGLFSIELGSVLSPLDPAIFNQDLWLGIAIGADPEMTPRKPLSSASSAFYAFNAGDAATLGGRLPADLDQSAHVVDTNNPHAVTAAQVGAVSTTAGAAHMANPSAHHARYTDAEAVAAVGPHTPPTTTVDGLTGGSIAGAVTAGSFSGDGSALTGITAGQVGADAYGSAAAVQANVDTHVADQANPHNVTAAQTGAADLAAPNTFAVGQSIQTGSGITTGLIVTGDPAQSASLQEWQDSAGTPLASVDAAGNVNAPSFSGDGSGLTGITAVQVGAIDQAALDTHAANASAHHAKTTSFADLGDVASDAQIPALITRDTELSAHTGNTSNPHAVTAGQVGADPYGSAAGVQVNLDTHAADPYAHHTRYSDAEAVAAVGPHTPPTTTVGGLTGGAITGSVTVDAATNALTGNSTDTVGAGAGVIGQSAGSNGYGVNGLASNTTGTNFGVYGKSQSSLGYGVYGWASSAGGGYGVGGRADSAGGYGVYGLATAPTGFGVYSQGNAHVQGNLSVSGAVSGDGSTLTGITAAQVGAIDQAALDAHAANASAHHAKTTSFADLVDTASDAQIPALIARDTEIMPTVLAGDGTGSGLDADLLDGLDSTAFASATHNHDATYVLKAGDTMTGPLGIGTSPVANLDVYGQAGVLFSGTLDPLTPTPLSASGAGTRMMWIPERSAFRAGTANSTEWDAANIGLYSTAMGAGTTASGSVSTAMGEATTASGTSSTAMGVSTMASGNNSTAMGVLTTASGVSSTALGSGTSAQGNYSMATGSNTVASSNNSTAMGGSTMATGGYSTAMGVLTTASGGSSTAMGANTIASGNGSTAMGADTVASGNYSTTMGASTTAPSFGEMAIGSFNTTYVPFSSIGWNSADRLFVIGNGQIGALSDALVMLKNGDSTFAGTITAPAFVGDGSGLTNVPGITSIDGLTGGTITGSVIAASFAGDGSALTGITAIQVNADAYGSAATVQGNLDTHLADTANPHAVTAAQAGAVSLAGDTMTGTLTINVAAGDGLSGTTASSTGAALRGTASSATGATYGVYGKSSSVQGSGVFGWADATTGTTYGVRGSNSSNLGTGVYGYASNTGGTTYGVMGRTASSAGYGVYGHANATSGATYGVYGISDSTTSGRGVYGKSVGTTGVGVLGVSTAATGLTEGVHGSSSSNGGTGVSGYASSPTGITYGVTGISASSSGYGVQGIAQSGTGVNYGVYGQSSSTTGSGVLGAAPMRGVFGQATATTGLNFGVYGESPSTSGYGVYSQGNAHVQGNLSVSGIISGDGSGLTNVPGITSVNGLAGGTITSAINVSGSVTATLFTGNGSTLTGITAGQVGAVAKTGDTMSGTLAVTTTGTALSSTSTDTTGFGVGAYGQSGSTTGVGVYGVASATSGTNYGVLGLTNSPSGYGVRSSGNAFVAGNLTVTGSISKASGTFIQPHAKDAAKEIHYAFFEGPEHAVFLRGSAQLKNGKAVIELPEHFRIVAAEEGVQAQVTPVEDCNGIYVAEKSRNRIVVKELMNGEHDASFDYFITGIREGFQAFEPVIANADFKPSADETAVDFEKRYAGDDLTTQAIRNMMISNGLFSKEGKLNMAMVKKLGWDVAEESVNPVQLEVATAHERQ